MEDLQYEYEKIVSRFTPPPPLCRYTGTNQRSFPVMFLDVYRSRGILGLKVRYKNLELDTGIKCMYMNKTAM